MVTPVRQTLGRQPKQQRNNPARMKSVPGNNQPKYESYLKNQVVV